MTEEVKLNHLEPVFAELEYPCSGQVVIEAVGDVTLQLADGTQRLGELIERSNEDSFETVDDLASEVRTLLPQRAVGEPYQSEGDS